MAKIMDEETSSFEDVQERIKYADAMSYVSPPIHKEYNRGLLKAHNEVVRRNISLTELLNGYIKQRLSKEKKKDEFKDILFYLFIFIIFVLTIIVIYVFKEIDINTTNLASIVSLISVGATYLGSIFAGYKIMFEYIFPPKEEENMIELIKAIVENDAKVEEFASKMSNLNNETKQK